MSKFQINHTNLSSSLFVIYTCILFSLTDLCVCNILWLSHTPLHLFTKAAWDNVSITMLKVPVRKLKICPRAESWWEKEKRKRMAYKSGPLCVLRTTTKLLCSVSFCFSLELCLGDNIVSTSGQNKTAYGKLILIISHLGKMQRKTKVSQYVINSRSVFYVNV